MSDLQIITLCTIGGLFALMLPAFILAHIADQMEASR